MFSFRQTIYHDLICAALIMALFLCGAPLFAQSAPAAGEGVITAYFINIRQRPDRAAEVVTVLRRHDRVKILEQQAEWLKIQHQTHTGYVRNRPQYIQIIAPAPASPNPEATAVRLNAAQAQMDSFTARERLMVNGLHDLEATLNQHKIKQRLTAGELRQTNEAIANNQAQLKRLKARKKSDIAYVRHRIKALYKLHMLGQLQVLMSADSLASFFRRQSAIEQILVTDEHVLQRFIAEQKKLTAIIADLKRQKQRKEALKADDQAQQQMISQEITKRQRLLQEIQSKKTLQAALIASLESASRKLTETIVKMEAPEAPQPEAVNKATPPNSSFDKTNKMPVNGKIINGFGPYVDADLHIKRFRNGIDIHAERGEPIRAVRAGKILFADWFKGYGNMMIIDHGGHYYSIYAHAEELFKKAGDPVEAQEVIATVGDSGSLTGLGLYFEVRYHGKPIDPVAWIQKG